MNEVAGRSRISFGAQSFSELWDCVQEWNLRECKHKKQKSRKSSAYFVLWEEAAHWFSKDENPLKTRLPWCDYTSFSMHVWACSHSFRFRSYHLLYIHRFSNLIFGGFLTFGSIEGRRAGQPTADGREGRRCSGGGIVSLDGFITCSPQLCTVERSSTIMIWNKKKRRRNEFFPGNYGNHQNFVPSLDWDWFE